MMKKPLLVLLTLLLICLALPALAAGPKLSFSLESGFYSDDMQLEIVCSSRNATVYYTLDGSVPDETGLVYAGPMLLTDSNAREDVLTKITGITGGEAFVPSVDFPTGHVVRAVAIQKNGARSAVISGTFFIGYDRKALYGDIPIMLLVTDPEGLFDYDTGIYVNGRYHDQWKAQQTQPYEEWQVQGNYSMRGDEWERAVSVTFLEEDGNGFTQEMGMRIKGGATRNHNQKSLRLIAREQYGKKNVKYELYPDNLRQSDGGVVNKYKSFTLRNGGNDD
ncbi:MAG: chitobiase/beta-hexosaminidase C-terminal domain-containing protein, partial [Clostridia bacterium]|nr:chitobiase/beta-hexosaminidase C-terminal domain-containing protein [Clostridia bacterium]